MKFDDLNFKLHPVHGGGIRAVASFPNGYGASVIRSDYSYGGKDGKFELAVLHRGDLCYDTPVTNDVLGWLSPEDVTAALQKIEALPAKEIA